jgi:outer membrane biosynthesis protein TonB
MKQQIYPDEDGKTAGLTVQKSSGDVALDRAAYEDIGSASPFDSLPA